MNLVNPSALARELGIRPQRVYNIIAERGIPRTTEGKKLFVDKADIMPYLNQVKPLNKTKVKKTKNLLSFEINPGMKIKWANVKGEKRVNVLKVRDGLVVCEGEDGKLVYFQVNSLKKKIARQLVQVVHQTI